MKRRQQGLTTVEFAVVGLLAVTLLFGIIETGRAMFIWNAATEATRRGVRVAAVCPPYDPAVARVTVFGEQGGNGSSPVLGGLNAGHVVVSYLDEGGGATGTLEEIRYVRVALNGYQVALFFPFGATYAVPAFPATLPAESLGYVPDATMACPFG